MTKKIILVIVLVVLAVTVLLRIDGFSTNTEITNSSKTKFKAVELEFQPTKKIASDRPVKFKRQLLNLLRDRQFAKLDKVFEEQAVKFENGKITEPEFEKLLADMAPIDPSLEEPILNWIEQSESWTAHIVGSKYFDSLAWQWRGNAFWDKVPEHNREKYKVYQAFATALIKKAKQNNKRDVLWYSDQISLANQSSSATELPLIKEGLSKFPDSIIIHNTAIQVQAAKWGGNESFRQSLIHDYATILDKSDHDRGPTINFFSSVDASYTRDYITAIRDIKKAIAQNPNRPWYYSTLARYYYKTDQYSLALAAINTAMEYHPHREKNLLTRAKIWLKVDEPMRAIKDLEMLLEFSPMHKGANTRAFSSYAKLGQREKALATLKRAEHFTQHNAIEIARLGFSAEHDLDDIELAKTYYYRAIEIDQLNSGAHYSLAALFGRNEDCKVAEHVYKYLKSCSSKDSYSRHWCKPRHKNWAISAVNHLKGHNQCTTINDYDFNGLL